MNIPMPNQVTNGGDFYISHNTVDSSIYGGETTALVWGQMQRFFILKGNHVAQYEALLGDGWDACVGYYRDQSEAWHANSDVLPCELRPLPVTGRR